MNFVDSRNMFGNGPTKEIPCLTGKGKPTTATVGAPGCLYMDTDSGAVYKCTAASNGVYTWVDALDSAEMKRVIEAYLEANPPADGEDGGHYTPIVTQPTADTMKVEFSPSKAGMAAVEPVTVKLPSGGSDSGENVADYAALSNKPSINGVELSGNMTAEELGIGAPSDEQVSAAVSGWLDEHPEATSTVQDGSVGWSKLAAEVLNNEAAVIPISDLTLANIYKDPPGYYAGAGSYGTQPIDISKGVTLHAESTVSRIVWYSYVQDGETVYVKNVSESDDYLNGLWTVASSSPIDGKYVLDLPLQPLRDAGIESISIGFHGKGFDETAQAVWLVVHEPSPALERAGVVRQDDRPVDTRYSVASGYSGPLFDIYGSSKFWFAGNTPSGHIDVRERKTLYIKVPLGNAADAHIGFGCYDADLNYLYSASKSKNETEVVIAAGSYVETGSDYAGIPPLVSPDGNNVYRVCFYSVTFPAEVAYVAYIPSLDTAAGVDFYTDPLYIVGYDPISDYLLTYEEYLNRPTDEFRQLVEDIAGAKDSLSLTGVFIGDSLTDWGGGDDASDGFLKIVHDKTGMVTKNEGTAGAWWQADASQTYSAVARVDAIISGGRKYDLYCFLMGTNAGANTDTGETSATNTTMPGAIRYCMEKLKSYDPTAKILVCLPPQRAEGNDNQKKVNAVIKAIAESYSVRTLDVFHHSGIVPNTVVADSNYLSDGLHLGDNGIKVLGDMLAAEIKYLFCL